MCSSASTRVCKRCVAGESWCPDGVWARACTDCAGPVASCTVLADAVCNTTSKTTVPRTSTASKTTVPRTSTTTTSLISTTKLAPKHPTTPVSLRMLRPAEAPAQAPPTTEPPPPVLPTPSRPNEPLIVAVVAGVALAIVLVLYCCCSPKPQEPTGRLAFMKLK